MPRLTYEQLQQVMRPHAGADYIVGLISFLQDIADTHRDCAMAADTWDIFLRSQGEYRGILKSIGAIKGLLEEPRP